MKIPERPIPDQPNTLSPEDIVKGAHQTPNNEQLHFETTDPGYTMDPSRQGLHRDKDQSAGSMGNITEWAAKLMNRFTEREMAIAAGLLLLGAGVTAVVLSRGSRRNKKDTTWKNPALHRTEGAYWNENPTNEYP